MKAQITGNSWKGQRAGRLAGVLGLLLTLVLLTGSVLPAYANDLEPPPQLPHLFAGTVSVTSPAGLVPEGTVVEALVDGAKKSETTVNGVGEYQLAVPGEISDEGKVVSFKVAGVQADQTTAWTAGELDTGFDLTIASLPGDSLFPFCFIATAAYGTDNAEEIDILREFRDVVLLPSSLGTELISLYYKTSPPIAEVISQHDFLRTAVRMGFVDPVVAILNWSYVLWAERGR
jgi:hypothetical protein